jgi:hypothetical protein
MDLSSFRDIVLIVWALIASVATIYLCVVVAMVRRQAASAMVALKGAAEQVNAIADQVNQEVVGPLSKIGSMLRGINQAVSFINKLINGKESS